MGGKVSIFDVGYGVPAAVFGLERSICAPISGLITGLGGKWWLSFARALVKCVLISLGHWKDY
jgi:hypothetical protein